MKDYLKGELILSNRFLASGALLKIKSSLWQG